MESRAKVYTPFFDKARSYTGKEPQPVPPVYAPEIVAKAILTAAQRPVRDVITGGAGRMLGISNAAPALADMYMERTMFRSQQTDRPTNGRPDNLYTPVAHDGGRRGRNWTGRTMESSLYTAATLHPRVALATVVGCLCAAAAAALAARRSRRGGDHGTSSTRSHGGHADNWDDEWHEGWRAALRRP